jgi:sec-independent protein translocase protein TatA
MGTLGVQEMIVIFLVALVLFGPKKLPELGKTIGKALTEFRRHSSDLKATFEREMHNLERETESLNQAARETATQIYDHATYQLEHAESEPLAIAAGGEPVPTPTTVGASEVPGAESNGAAETAALREPENAMEHAGEHSPAIEGTVPRTEQPAALAEIAKETAHEPTPVESKLAVETPQHS